ncbi:MAG: glycosyltransferase, partial [Chloroflexota bacterium]
WAWPDVRVLFTCIIGFGHFYPLVPLARAFEKAGHEVAFATDPGFCGSVAETGFTAFPAGLDHAEAQRRFVAMTPGWDEVAPQDRAAYIMPGMFGQVRVPPMLADLAPLIARWRPDLLIHDSAEMAGAIAAEVVGLPHAEHSFGLLRPRRNRRRATDVLAPISASLGVPNPGVGGINGETYLDVCPPGLQFPEIADLKNRIALRPEEFETPPDPDFERWIAARSSRPLVYLTMGTIFNALDTFRTILAGLASERIHVVVTVGAAIDPADLGAAAAGHYIRRFIPQAEVLRQADLMISHGGSGAMLGVLNAAVPMLAIPQGADQFMNAARMSEAGVGLEILPDQLSPDAVRHAVERLLQDPGFATAACSLRAEIAAMPAPSSVVSHLEALVR